MSFPSFWSLVSDCRAKTANTAARVLRATRACSSSRPCIPLANYTETLYVICLDLPRSDDGGLKSRL